MQAIGNIVAQCGGACIGSLLLWGTSDLRSEPVLCCAVLCCAVLCCAVLCMSYVLAAAKWLLCVDDACNHLAFASPPLLTPPAVIACYPPCAGAGLGANSVGAAYTVGNAVLGEIVCTFILVRGPLLCRQSAGGGARGLRTGKDELC